MVDRHHPGKAPTAVLQKLAPGLCMTIEDLAAELDLTRRQVSDAASNLIRRRYLERLAVGCYQLTPEGTAAAAAGEIIRSGPKGPSGKPLPPRPSFRQRAWSAMRVRRIFTVTDLVMDAATPVDRKPIDNLHRYLRVLVAAGYVAKADRRIPGTAPTSPGFHLYRLVRNTGLTAPTVRDAGIHDFNLGEDVPCAPR